MRGRVWILLVALFILFAARPAEAAGAVYTPTCADINLGNVNCGDTARDGCGNVCGTGTLCSGSGIICCNGGCNIGCTPSTTSSSGCGLYEQRTCNPDGCGYGACKCNFGYQLYGSNYCPKQFQFKTCQGDGSWSACKYDCTNICAIADNCNVPVAGIDCYLSYACTGTTCSPGVAKPEGETCSVPVCGGFSAASGLCHSGTCDPNYIACQSPNFCYTTVPNSHLVTGTGYTYFCTQNQCRACNTGFT